VDNLQETELICRQRVETGTSGVKKRKEKKKKKKRIF